MRNAGLDEAQAGIKIAKKNINNLRYADNTTLMAESREELKSPLMNMNLGKLWEMMRDREGRHASWGPQGHIDMTG